LLLFSLGYLFLLLLSSSWKCSFISYPLSGVWFSKLPSYSMDFLFTFFMVPFEVQKCSVLLLPTSRVFLLLLLVFWGHF
jgi:hypothetical protein